MNRKPITDYERKSLDTFFDYWEYDEETHDLLYISNSSITYNDLTIRREKKHGDAIEYYKYTCYIETDNDSWQGEDISFTISTGEDRTILDIDWYSMAKNKELLEQIYNKLYDVYNMFDIKSRK